MPRSLRETALPLFMALWMALTPSFALAGSMTLLGVGGSGVTGSFSITNTDFQYDTTAGTTFNFGTVNIGSADSSRLVVVACASRQAGTVGAASSVSINSTSATLVVSGVSTGTTSTVDIYQLAVASGTTATLSVTYPSSMLRSACGVYSVIKSNGVVPSGAAIATSINNGNSATPISAAITVPSGGGSIILGSCSNGPPAPTFTASANYTKDQDTGASTALGVTTGHDTSHSGSQTYTETQSVTCNQPVGAFAAWHP